MLKDEIIKKMNLKKKKKKLSKRNESPKPVLIS